MFKAILSTAVFLLCGFASPAFAQGGGGGEALFSAWLGIGSLAALALLLLLRAGGRWLRAGGLFAVALAFLAAWPDAAFAQTAGESFPLDVTPLVELAGFLLIAIVGPLLVRAAKRLGDRLGVEIDAETLFHFEQALERSVALAVKRVGPVTIDARSRLLKEAGDYLVRNAPDALKRFKLADRHGIVDWDRLEELIDSRGLLDAQPAGGAP